MILSLSDLHLIRTTKQYSRDSGLMTSEGKVWDTVVDKNIKLVDISAASSYLGAIARPKISKLSSLEGRFCRCFPRKLLQPPPV
jgi:hypothetical protein